MEFVGYGALGEDPGNLVPDSIFDGYLPADRLEELERAVYGAYVRGLEAAGWRGDPAQVRLGFTASAVKYCWLAPHMAASPPLGVYAAASGRDPQAVRAGRVTVLERLVDWADEARSLTRAS